MPGSRLESILEPQTPTPMIAPPSREIATPSVSNIVHARKKRKLTVPEDLVLLLGTTMMAWGMFAWVGQHDMTQYYWIMGGFLVFFLAIEALPEKSHSEAKPDQKPGHEKPQGN